MSCFQEHSKVDFNISLLKVIRGIFIHLVRQHSDDAHIISKYALHACEGTVHDMLLVYLSFI